MDILDYQLTLDHGDILRLEGELKIYFNKIQLKVDGKDEASNIFTEHEDMELNYLIRDFNNKKFSLKINYALAKKYLEKGIPDTPYYQSPGKNGSGVSYFPLFQEENYVNHYWYGFYIEAFYFRFEGLVDSIYHIVNSKFNLGISTGVGFQNKILKKLKIENPPLALTLENIKKDDVYMKAKHIRNDITHNFSPNQLSSGIKIHKNKEGIIEGISSSIPEYMSVLEIQTNIDKIIKLLAKLTDNIQQKL